MSWTSVLLEASVKGTVVLLAAAALCLALRRGPASARHLVWLLALVSLVMLPGLLWAAPAWRIAVFPPEAAFDLLASAGASTDPGGMRWTWVVLAVWAAGLVAVLGRAVVAAASAWRIARRGTPLGSSDGFPLVGSDQTAMPMTCGLLRPVLVLPSGAGAWDAGLRRSVLLHELAHAQRRDPLARVPVQLACAMYWFHPLVWWGSRQLLRESERACDDRALAAGADPADYAAHLVAVARSYCSARWVSWATAVMARPSELEGRVEAILDPTVSRRALPRFSSALGALAVAAMLWPLASVRLSAQEPGAAGFQAPRVIHRVNTAYPKGAKLRKIEGAVELAVDVSAEGTPDQVRVSRGVDPDLDQAAVEAVQQWRWEPARKDGEPVSAATTVTINFSLVKKDAPASARAGQDVVKPVLLSKVEPKYTQEARDAKIQGEVEVYVEVGADGRAHNLKIQQGLDPGLDEKALEAIRDWRFQPATKDGQPVPAGAVVRIRFELR